MIQPFRKIRQKLLSDGSLKRYILYAIGEVLLVVIGILLALQINNWNEERKERNIEIEILMGIRDDILKDTIDINWNIQSYQRRVNNNLLLLDHLTKKKEYDSSIGIRLYRCGFLDDILTLHFSHFEEAKQRGLEIFKNAELRERINRLYEYNYTYLMFLENEYVANDPFPVLNPLINRYLEIDLNQLKADSLFRNQNPTTISFDSYSKLLLDKELQYQIMVFTRKERAVLENDYQHTRDEALKVVDLINEELTKFD